MALKKLGAQNETREIPGLQLRADVQLQTFNAESRKVQVVWSTGARVKRGGFWSDPYWEELDMSPQACRLDRLNSGKAPVLDNHSSYEGANSVIGVIESASVDGKRGIATLRFPKIADDAEADQIFRKIGDGIIANVSVGYRVNKMIKVEDGPDMLPVMRVVDWTPMEISPVALPADPEAGFRSEEKRTNPVEIVSNAQEDAMTEAEKLAAAATRAAEVARAAELPKPPTAPAPSHAETEAAGLRAEGAKAEGVRRFEIERCLRVSGLPAPELEPLRRKLIDDVTVSIDAARKAVMDALAARSDASPNASQVIVVGDDLTKLGTVGRAQAWLLEKAGQSAMIREAAKKFPEKFKDLIVDPGEFRGMTLSEMARDSLERAGVKNLRGMDRQQMVGDALIRGINGGNSTTDFPVALENTLHKVLLAAYLITQDTWENFCLIGTVSDFRAHPRYRMGSFGVLDALGEGGEYKSKSIPDATKQSITAATKGNVIALTRKAIINDDMDVFSRVAMMLGRAAKLSIEVDVYALLALNGGLGPTMADALPLIDAGHANLGASSALTVIGLDADRVVMKNQKDQDGNEYLDLGGPSILVVNTGLGSTARVINDAQYDPDTANKLQRPNAMRGLFAKIVDTPRVASPIRYLFADPAVAPVLEVAFLDGQREPFMETRQGWTIDGTEWKVRLDYAAGAIDTKGIVYNAGV